MTTTAPTPTVPLLSYARAFDVILHNAYLSPGEKLVLIEVTRFWPSPYHGSNATIAHNVGLSPRQVQRHLLTLSTGPATRSSQGKYPRRAYIHRAYAHSHQDGQPFTTRIILPLCLPRLPTPPKSLDKKTPSKP